MMPTFPPRVEQFLSKTDAARRTDAHTIWLSGREPGTNHDIYLRLYAADGERYQESL